MFLFYLKNNEINIRSSFWKKITEVSTLINTAIFARLSDLFYFLKYNIKCGHLTF